MKSFLVILVCVSVAASVSLVVASDDHAAWQDYNGVLRLLRVIELSVTDSFVLRDTKERTLSTNPLAGKESSFTSLPSSMLSGRQLRPFRRDGRH